jgi:hypothetical protein
LPRTRRGGDDRTRRGGDNCGHEGGIGLCSSTDAKTPTEPFTSERGTILCSAVVRETRLAFAFLSSGISAKHKARFRRLSSDQFDLPHLALSATGAALATDEVSAEDKSKSAFACANRTGRISCSDRLLHVDLTSIKCLTQHTRLNNIYSDLTSNKILKLISS